MLLKQNSLLDSWIHMFLAPPISLAELFPSTNRMTERFKWQFTEPIKYHYVPVALNLVVVALTWEILTFPDISAVEAERFVLRTVSLRFFTHLYSCFGWIADFEKAPLLPQTRDPISVVWPRQELYFRLPRTRWAAGVFMLVMQRHAAHA